MDKQAQGKKNREAGRRFELKVRKDLEKKGWIVSKWQNNVEFENVKGNEPVYENSAGKVFKIEVVGKCVPAKRKYNPFSRALSVGTGFPDFFCYKEINHSKAVKEFEKNHKVKFFTIFDIIFVECKSDGYLDKVEKEKASWYLKNNYCSKFLIASKGKKRGEINYEQWT